MWCFTLQCLHDYAININILTKNTVTKILRCYAFILSDLCNAIKKILRVIGMYKLGIILYHYWIGRPNCRNMKPSKKSNTIWNKIGASSFNTACSNFQIYQTFSTSRALRTQLFRGHFCVYLKPDFRPEKFSIWPVAPGVTREKQPRRSKQDPNNCHQRPYIENR